MSKLSKLGKIVEISGFAEKGFEAICGIKMGEGGRKEFSFGTLIPTGVFLEGKLLTYMYSSYVEYGDKWYVTTDYFPDQKPSSVIDEEFLWVIIQYSSGIETEAKKIAGKTPTEGIFEMHVGETVTVKKAENISETYMVVQGGNELFLVKKNR